MAHYDTDDYDYDAAEELRRRKARARRKAEMRRKKKRRFYIRVALRLALYVLILVAIITGIVLGIKKIISLVRENTDDAGDNKYQAQTEELTEEVPTQVVDFTDVESHPAEEETFMGSEGKIYSATASDAVTGFPEGVASQYGIFIDLETGLILEQQEPKTKMFPASMTKILTCLVAAEHLTEAQLDDTFIMTPEINYYAYKNDCSTVGFSDDEEVTVRDLLYGTILPSGGDAAVGLATYIAGSHEDFVVMMNEKLEELGLSETTHFTNCVGLYDDDHYSTCYDMAMIMEACMDNELCREVMHAHTYTTSSTTQHPDGITVSNWFLRRIEDHVSGGEVYAAKTGFVNESGNCAVSYGIDSSGHEYICATGNSTSSWKCIKDHVAIYQTVFPTESSTAE